MRKLAVAIAILGAACGLLAGCSGGRSAERATPPGTTTVGSSVSTTSAPAVAPTGNPTPPPVTDADAHGFTVFGDGARCVASDNAEMFMRTAQSALVVCRSEINRLYYRGYRISDGASIYLQDVSRQPDGFVVVNAANNARYVITSGGFQLIQNGAVVVSESAVESGPSGWTGAGSSPSTQVPMTQAASTVVLGSASAMGPASRGYGSEQPAVISMGSCANAISKIVWQDWGAPMAHGSGLGCVQVGKPPQYQLVDSDIGICQGVLAYRKLQIGDGPGPSQDICNG